MQKKCHEQCDQIWQNFATLAQFQKSLAILKGFLVFANFFNPLWQMFFDIW